MKKLNLDPKWSAFLENFPENGMGYQLVNIIFRDGKKLTNRTVLNGRLLVVEEKEPLNLNDIKDIEWVNSKRK